MTFLIYYISHLWTITNSTKKNPVKSNKTEKSLDFFFFLTWTLIKTEARFRLTSDSHRLPASDYNQHGCMWPKAIARHHNPISLLSEHTSRAIHHCRTCRHVSQKPDPFCVFICREPAKWAAPNNVMGVNRWQCLSSASAQHQLLFQHRDPFQSQQQLPPSLIISLHTIIKGV